MEKMEARFPLYEDITTHKIMALDIEKRDRIISAAMAEFSKGYHRASTDAITQNAGISKGLLFHYFGSKQELFFFLLQYALAFLQPEYDRMNTRSADLFEGLLSISLAMARLTMNFPQICAFVTPAFASAREAFPHVFASYQSPVEAYLEKLIAGANREELRADVDADMALQMISWTVLGLQEKLARGAAACRTMEQCAQYYAGVQQEFDRYLTLMRKLFSKREALFWVKAQLHSQSAPGADA